MSLVEVNDLGKSYGSLAAVQGLTFQIEEGEVFSLLGPNGAGKSTTIGMLCGLVDPSAGDARIGGISIRGRSRQLRRTCGIVPQEIALYEELSVRDNLVFWGRLYGLRGKTLGTRVQAALSRFGLADRATSVVRTLSGGMKRRLNIAAGILHGPRLVFMDEPTVGIDPQSRRAILDLILELKAQGSTVLYTTHYMAEAEELSDRVGIIDHGRLLAMGSCKELAQGIGGQESVLLQLGNEEDGGRLVQELEGMPGVKAASDGSRVTVAAARVSQILPRIVEAAASIRASLRDIEIREPNLETVFLAYTGRALTASGGEA
ncbi:MAG TPA: ABC transporter ATP-binding protein [Spirochaetia bacterium]|nr:ABC transporter ATP-binding protein [Spirochaetia bacterium]